MQKGCLLFLLTIIVFIVSGQQQRALVIGINTYSAPVGSQSVNDRFSFADLEGARNDAEAVYSTLINRYGFVPATIKTLYDRDATRINILDAIDQLLTNSNPGDIAVLYYAGHGSQVKNSISSEPDKKDETIVPTDAWKQEGMDITDKELARQFNRFIDKRVKLTVLFDCCHSGSLSRGISLGNPKQRSLKQSDFDSKDENVPIAPEKRKEGGFVAISASQDNEFAVEQLDDQNIPHGSFTIALLQAIYQQPADASAQNLFNSTRAILKMNGKKQEPVLAGDIERKSQTLFGISSARLSDKLLIPVTAVSGNRIDLQAGFAEYLEKGNELTAQVKNNEGMLESQRIRIDTVLSITRSRGTLIEGHPNLIKGGELFELTNWVASEAPLLKVYIPPSIPLLNLNKLVATCSTLRQSTGEQWIKGLDNGDPELMVHFIKDSCYIYDGKGKLTSVKGVTAAGLGRVIQKKKYFVSLPPSKELSESLIKRFSAGRSIALVTNPAEAHYYLYGTLNNKSQPVYGFMRVEAKAKDSLESLPIQTRNFIVPTDKEGLQKTTDSLHQLSLRLSKARGWLTLQGPKNGAAFPFHLELRNTQNGKRVDTTGVRIKEEVSLYIVSNSGAKYTSIAQKYIYSFGLDKNGTMTLLFPEENTGNADNKFPRYNSGSLEEEVMLLPFSIDEPSGTDTYFLVACDEPIQNYEILFKQSGTRSISSRQSNHPIVQLLNLGNDGQLRGLKKSSSNWNLIRMTVKSSH